MPISSKAIGLGIIAVGIAAGTAIIVVNLPSHPARTSVGSINPQSTVPVASVHTADWYVAHPAALKADDAKCGDNPPSISQAACENAATADEQVLAQQLQAAAAANAAAAKTSASKTP